MENKEHTGNENAKFWFPLDNAAKIFPATINDEFTAVFRIAAQLKQAIKIEAFLKAVLLAEKRFPYFQVQLKKGFFWYYLEQVPYHFSVEIDTGIPSRRFPKNSLLIRIMISGNKVFMEFSHILTDGSGGFEFLKTVLSYYLKELNHHHPADTLKSGEMHSAEEYEDSYKRYFMEELPPMLKRSKAFHLPWPLQPPPRFKIRNMKVPIGAVKKLAGEKGVTINDYFVALYMYFLQEFYEEMEHKSNYKKKKQIRIQVPLNLRTVLPSKTMRNFSLFVMPEIDLRLGHYTFDEILKTVHHQIRLESDEKLINKNISRNVGSEKKIYIKSMPLAVKSFILRMKFYSLGPSQFSGVITNLGKVNFQPDVEQVIDYLTFTPPPPNKLLKVSCGIIGFNNHLVLSFGNITKSTRLEEKFLQHFREKNIEVNFDLKL